MNVAANTYSLLPSVATLRNALFFAEVWDALHNRDWSAATARSYAAAYPEMLDDGPITDAERFEGLARIACDALSEANNPAVMVRLAHNAGVIASAWQAEVGTCST